MLPVIRTRVAPSAQAGGRELDRFLSAWDGRELDRVFSAAFGLAPSLSGWSPPVDVEEDADAYRVTVELPGMTPEDVEVNVENGVLSISGEKREHREEESESGGRRIVERRYGRFNRNFSLSRSVDAAKVQAGFENGILTVTLPKAAEAKPRRIKVTS